jgi:hypothetical protein
MATYTVGSGYSYSTIQAAEDAMAATRTEDEIAEIYNTAEYSAADTILTVSGHTGNFYCIFRAASGQGFSDNGSVRTNALRYNQSNGVALSHTGGFSGAVVVANNYTRIENLQIKTTGNYGSALGANSYTDIIFKNIFAQGNNREAIFGFANGTSSGQVWINCIGYFPNNNTSRSCMVGSYGVTQIGCSAIRASNQTAAGTGFESAYGVSFLRSCCSFGFTTAASSGGWATGSCANNATDQSSGLPGSGQVYSVTYNATTPFTQADASGSIDFRSIASTSLAAAGYYDGTNAPLDISGYTRANPPTIGHWEITASGGGPTTTSARRTLLGVGI